MHDDGYIKFNYEWVKSEPVSEKSLEKVKSWRSRLSELGLIGSYPNGIGFGNISIRDEKGFIISGSKTGYLKDTDRRHYTKVIRYDFERNFVLCKGPIVASSESLTHAAFYEADKSANCVIHVHNLSLWEALLNKMPTTNKVPYGSLEMTKEIFRLLKEDDARIKKTIIMAGHKEGIICFGNDVDDAGNRVLSLVSIS